MKPAAKNVIKPIAILLILSVIYFFGLVIYGLYLMDIEDRYGDLQDLYWKSKTGDILVNEANSEIGLVSLDWHRIYIKKGETWIHVEEWLGEYTCKKWNVAIYRPEKTTTDVENLSLSEVRAQSDLVTEITLSTHNPK